MFRVQGGGVGGPWEYASLSAAESSGDPWTNGDAVLITGGASFYYFADLAVDGYSGLIHQTPYGAGLGTIDTVTLRGSNGANTDPDSWSNFTDLSTGTQGVDYEFDTDGGLSRLRDILEPGSGFGKLESNFEVTDDGSTNESFRIVDDISGTTTSTSSSQSFMHTCQVQCYLSSNRHWTNLCSVADSVTTNWRVNHTDFNTFTTTSKSRTSASRVFLYVKGNRYAVWFDDDATPESSGTATRSATYAAGEGLVGSQVGSASANTGLSTLLMGTDVFGNFSSS